MLNSTEYICEKDLKIIVFCIKLDLLELQVLIFIFNCILYYIFLDFDPDSDTFSAAVTCERL